VVDGSPDLSHRLLNSKLQDVPFRAELIELARNFGSFAAIRLGLAVASGPYFAVMAADLQEPAELMPEFLRCLATEPVDIVCGERLGREDPRFSRLASGIFWGLYQRLIQPAMPSGGVDVFACNKAVRDVLLEFDETNTSLVGQLFWLGFRKKFIPYRRRARQGGGRSGWTFRRKLRYLADNIFAFTDLPITILTITGVAGIAISVLVSGIVFLSWLAGAIPVLGYTPVILLVALSTSLNLLTTGILGGYLWRAYENTKRRPLAIPMSRQSFPEVHTS
jgi:glycosyltransferase involved in cell wall biosynthesis